MRPIREKFLYVMHSGSVFYNQDSSCSTFYNSTYTKYVLTNHFHLRSRLCATTNDFKTKTKTKPRTCFNVAPHLLHTVISCACLYVILYTLCTWLTSPFSHILRSLIYQGGLNSKLNPLLRRYYIS